MSFRKNTSNQISFDDVRNQLTSREQRALEKSWATIFAEEVFPFIDEEQFAALYSAKCSRPNTPVNVIVGALILKDIFGVTEDMVVENLLLDPRWQVALHTTSFPEQPISDRTFSRFRERLVAYERATGKRPLHDCMKSLSKRVSAVMNLTGTLRRMDSMMIASNTARLGRIELLYTCNARLVVRDQKNGMTIEDRFEHYLDSADHNRKFYQTTSEQQAEILEEIIEDSQALLAIADGIHEKTKEYAQLKRAFAEQTITDEKTEKKRLRTSEDGGMHSGIMQTPIDDEASFRSKAGKEHIGYVANLEEYVGANGSVIADWDLQPNNYSDSQFMKDTLEKMDRQEEPVTLVADGAYGGEANENLAKEKNVNLVTTNMPGSEPDPVFGDFKFDESGEVVVECPAGHAPLRCGGIRKDGKVHLTFERDHCSQCPHQAACRAKVNKKNCTLDLSLKTCARARYIASRDTKEFSQLSRIRNGVETVPSTLRSKYKVDTIPVRGLARKRLFLDTKVGAFNFKKLLNFLTHRGHYAQNPVLEGR